MPVRGAFGNSDRCSFVVERTVAGLLAVSLSACPSPPPVITDDGTDASSDASGGSTSAVTTSASETTADPEPDTSGTDAESSSSDGTTGAPAAPVANDDELFSLQSEQLIVPSSDGLLSNDVPGSGGPLSVVDVDEATAAGGSIIVGGDGALTYLPREGFWGRDSFGYTVGDGTMEASASVTVFVGPVALNVAELEDESGGFVIDGVAAQTTAPMRDLNGDGYADVAMGAPFLNANGNYSGRCYVVFGKPDSAGVDALGLFASGDGYVLNGEFSFARACESMSTIDDVDGDGLDELLIGSTLEGGSQAGRTYVALGKADSAAIELATVTDSSGGFRLDGEAAGTYSGYAVANVGDVNGDGESDLAIGAPRADFGGSDTGRVYVVFGDSALADRPLSVVASGTGGFVVEGPMLDGMFGWRLAAAGDMDGDGLQDVLVAGASGGAAVIFGKATTEPVQAGMFGLVGGGFEISGEGFSTPLTVSGAGDVNGDGAADLLIGAAFDTFVRAYIVHGKGDSSSISLSEVAAGDGGYALDVGLAEGGSTTVSLAALGDMSGDGLDDMLVGAPGANRSYVVYGSDGAVPRPGTTLADVADGIRGFTIEAANAADELGRFVGGGGDIDGDGVADLVIGGAEDAYVIFGVPTAAG